MFTLVFLMPLTADPGMQREAIGLGHPLQWPDGDMNLSIELQLEVFELEKAGIDSRDKLARDLKDGTLNGQDRDSTVQALNYIGWVENPKTRLVTLNELQSSGNISHIQNSEIRDVELRSILIQIWRRFACCIDPPKLLREPL
jgi:hypothetical protein